MMVTPSIQYHAFIRNKLVAIYTDHACMRLYWINAMRSIAISRIWSRPHIENSHRNVVYHMHILYRTRMVHTIRVRYNFLYHTHTVYIPYAYIDY